MTKRGRPRKQTHEGPYAITQSETGKWIVRLGGSVVYAADTKDMCEEYVEMVIR